MLFFLLFSTFSKYHINFVEIIKDIGTREVNKYYALTFRKYILKPLSYYLYKIINKCENVRRLLV